MVINNLTVTTNKGRVLISDFSFTLNSGDKIGLIGEEGNGKSTLLKIMAGHDVADYVTWTGKVDSQGDIVAYLPQKPDEGWQGSSLLQFIVKKRPEDEFPLEIYDEFGELSELAARVNLPIEFLNSDRSISTYSGGEKVKAAMAKMLYCHPTVLLMDEPTNDLDLKTLVWLEEFIRNTDIPMIFISHDETLLENCTNGILHLEQLKKKSEARITWSHENYRDYFQRRSEGIIKNNMVAASQKARLEKQLARYRQIYQKVEYRQSTISRQDAHGGQLLKKIMRSLKAQGQKLEEKKE